VKVVINTDFGGFSLSEEAVLWIRKNRPCDHKEVLVGETYEDGSKNNSEYLRDSNFGHAHGNILETVRACPSLVAAVKALGRKVNGRFAKLAIIEIPDGIEFEVTEYDGYERVEEKHRSWP
jgi:hypothetical protein